MKQPIFSTFFLLFFFIAFACNNAVNSGNKTATENSDGYFMNAKIGDTQFSASGIREVSGVITSSTGTLNIIGSNGSKSTLKYVSLGVTSYTNTPGTYNIVPGKIIGSLSLRPARIQIAVYGKIILTSANAANVSGSFSFTCKDSTKVSGTFVAPVHTL